MYHNPYPYPVLSDSIKNAIKRGDIDFFDQIPDTKRAEVCSSFTDFWGIIPYSFLKFILKHNQFQLCQHLIVNPAWHKHLEVFLKTLNIAPLYQFAIEKNEQKLVHILKETREIQDQKTYQQLNKALHQCNLFKNTQLNSNIGGIIADYLDATAITLGLK